MRRLFAAGVLVAAVGLTATPVDARPDIVHAVGPAQLQTPLAHPGLSDDICRYIIAAGHPKDIVRSHIMFADGNHVYCSWWHMIETKPGVWHSNGYCHQGDYFINTGNYYPGPIFPC